TNVARHERNGFATFSAIISDRWLFFDTFNPHSIVLAKTVFSGVYIKRGERMKGYFLTDRGKIRHHNEDSGGVFHNCSQQLMAVVADGMGGHRAGDVASQMAINLIRDQWEKQPVLKTPEDVETWMQETIQALNRSIYNEAMKHDAYMGMGTTLVVAICTQDFTTVGHIGDSRCYLLNDDGFKQMTEEEATHHPRKKCVLKALGTEADISADIDTFNWKEGDKLLLCSDGLTDKMTDPELVEFLRSDQTIEKTAQNMIDLANERGG